MSASNRRSHVLLQAIAAVGVIAGWAIAARASVPITLIADTSTPISGGTGDYTSFGLPVADRDNPEASDDNVEDIVFPAQGAGNLSGIYGYLQVPLTPGGTFTEVYDIVDTTTAAPTGGYYSGFSSLSGGYGEIGFIANTTTGTQLLMATDSYDPLTVIAQTGTSPSPGQTFGSFQSLSVMEGTNNSNQYVMEGEVVTDIGIYDFYYPSGGEGAGGPSSFSLVANTATTPPGASSPFSSFGAVSYKAARDDNLYGAQNTFRAVVATVGTGPAQIQGIYYGGTFGPLAPLTKLADTTTTIPGGGGTFTGFEDPVATANDIAFIASYSTPTGSQQGIFDYGPYYYYSGNYGEYGVPTFTQSVATGDVAPDSDGAHFTAFLALADTNFYHAGYDQVFVATLDNDEEGLYAHIPSSASEGYPGNTPSELIDVLDTSDMLDGKSIAGIELSSEGAGYAGTAFEVNFADGSEGIYYFQLPESSFLPLFALPLLLILRRRKGYPGRINGDGIRFMNLLN